MAEYDRFTALLVVDVQNDFADPEGSLSVRGGEEVVPVVNAEIERAVAASAAVACSQDWHPEITPHFEKDGGIWPVHCVHDTWGAELHPGLVVPEDHVLIRKGIGGEDGYSAFSVRDPRGGEAWETALGSALRDRMVKHVVVCGLATDYCVMETVTDARARHLDVTVLLAGIRAVEVREGDGQRALERMRAVGAVIE
jgi:nicotinamidase/pyrazinamidase